MFKKISAIAAGAVLAAGVAVGSAGTAQAAPAPAAVSTIVPAGNGTSNFYGTGGCGVNMPLGTWASSSWTNYDNGSSQTIHWSVKTSGAAIGWQIYVNGVLKKSGYGASSGYISWPGWSRVVVGLRAWVPGGAAYNCSDSYT